MSQDFLSDINAVQSIAAVPTILDIVCGLTGMGFAAVARVTEDHWIACQVLDNVDFGLPAGGELKAETTLCHEIRQHRDVVAIDNVADDPVYAEHHTPKLYGLQSYISVPVVLPDGTFFGTLCAISAAPARVKSPEIIGTFKLFAELIAHPSTPTKSSPPHRPISLTSAPRRICASSSSPCSATICAIH